MISLSIKIMTYTLMDGRDYSEIVCCQNWERIHYKKFFMDVMESYNFYHHDFSRKQHNQLPVRWVI